MTTRRRFLRAAGLSAAGLRMLPEMAYAQLAVVGTPLPENTVWLNANENPEGPPQASIEAMSRVLPTTGRYHYQEFRDFYAAVAKSEDLPPDQVLVGSGSTEVLHAAVDALTSASLPLIAIDPTYEGPVRLAQALGRKVVLVPLTESYTADVKKLVAEARQAGGGLIYLCNPNNPTGTVTPKTDIAWLAANLPPNTVALIDEAYCHFADTPEFESALAYVRQGKDVVVTRTFSKIWGMAGLRCGFACARADWIAKMAPFRNNVISYVTSRAVLAALEQASAILPERRARLLKTRRELCGWLKEKNVEYIESHANFVMIDVKRDVREVIPQMAGRGVAVGRPFPPLMQMMRVSIGTDAEMARFREVFWSVHSA